MLSFNNRNYIISIIMLTCILDWITFINEAKNSFILQFILICRLNYNLHVFLLLFTINLVLTFIKLFVHYAKRGRLRM